jgi:hypothetical protein
VRWPRRPVALTRRHVEAFLADYAATHKPATVSLVFRALQQFGTWLADEEDLDRSPLDRMNLRSSRNSRYQSWPTTSSKD